VRSKMWCKVPIAVLLTLYNRAAWSDGMQAPNRLARLVVRCDKVLRILCPHQVFDWVSSPGQI
jgi:hypothetical protein